jgi:hypothetical protein
MFPISRFGRAANALWLLNLVRTLNPHECVKRFALFLKCISGCALASSNRKLQDIEKLSNFWVIANEKANH